MMCDYDRDSLGRKSVLVVVARDGGDSLDAEVEVRKLGAVLLREGDDEAAEAAVDVQSDLVLERDLGERRDRVNGSVRELRAAADNLM